MDVDICLNIVGKHLGPSGVLLTKSFKNVTYLPENGEVIIDPINVVNGSLKVVDRGFDYKNDSCQITVERIIDNLSKRDDIKNLAIKTGWRAL